MVRASLDQTNPVAVIFDLDGVLTDTAELHYQSWQRLADELGIRFDRQRNDALRGIGRMESLAIVLGDRWDRFSTEERVKLADRKNEYYLELVARMTSAELLPGAGRLLRELRRRGVRIAVASSSRNARRVVEQLGIRRLLDALVDGNDAPRSKPDPQVFLLAAERVGARPARCVVVEDAESGIDAALAAGMKVVGIGPPERVRRATRVAGAVAELSAGDVLSLVS